MGLFTLTDMNKWNILPSWIKFSFIGFSGVLHVQTVSFNTPTIVGHHVSIPPSLVSLVHSFYILMKPFNLLITYVIKIFRKYFKITVEKTNFYAHVATQTKKILKQCLNKIFVIFRVFSPGHFSQQPRKNSMLFSPYL